MRFTHRFALVLHRVVPERLHRFLPNSITQYFPYKSSKVAGLLIGVGSILVVVGMVLFAVLETKLYIQTAQALQFEQAQKHAQRATPMARILSTVTFHSIPDIEAWNHGLAIGRQLTQLQTAVTAAGTSLTSPNQEASLTQVLPVVQDLAEHTQAIERYLPESYFLKKMISQEQVVLLSQFNQLASQLDIINDTILTGKQTWVVVLQNSDELRATGGFAGSYALVTLQDGALQEIVIEDIYDADGQFVGYLPAPAGMREYTSSSRGLRLPDANWFPHFPQSAQTMLQFFAFGKKRDIQGVISVNLPVAESILRVTGPLPIPDYNTTLTAENLHTVLREERAEFFPGSIQKKHILSQAEIVLRQRLTELSQPEQLQIVKNIAEQTMRKEIQVYALDPQLQAAFSNYGVTGELGLSQLQEQQLRTVCADCASPTVLYLVESNVGINKANRYISRSVLLTAKPDSANLQLTIEFHNNAPRAEDTLLSPVVGSTQNPMEQIATNGYANYQRLLISPTYELISATLNGEPIRKIDSERLTFDQVTVTQYGFLAIVLPETSAQVVLELQPTVPGYSLTKQPLLIQKQSGLAPTPYTLQLSDFQDAFILEKDRLVLWGN